VGIALHGDSGPWGKCPNPKHPQNCSAMYRSLTAGADAWAPTEGLPGNALIQPTEDNTSRGFSGKVVIDPSTNTTGTWSWREWRWAAGAGVSGIGGVGKSAVTGLPPIDGTFLSVLPSSIRLPDGSWLVVAYGATQADEKAGSGNRTCVPMFHWQSHFCVAVFVLATADEGRSWQLANPSAPFSPRSMHSSVSLRDGSIYVLGGAAPVRSAPACHSRCPAPSLSRRASVASAPPSPASS
jgi:hypothetical protein